MELVTSKLVDVASSKCREKEEEDEVVMLPGFRFHPTDEELVGFYLRRKVEKRPITLEIIKQIDIYKYDPWDLPKLMSNSGSEKEWYLFCIRGRKYRNSIRPNRVTGSGFWKATGIDKPIHSTAHCSNINIIGLKKSLVYYRGSAGKGTKTDWMMHEFRLPTTNNFNTKASQDHAEVWTLCRIFKRVSSFRKFNPTTNNNNYNNNNNNNNLNLDSSNTNFQSQPFPTLIDLETTNPKPFDQQLNNIFAQKYTFFNPNLTLPPPSFHDWNRVNGGGGGDDDDNNNVFTNGGWDELRSVVQVSSSHPSSQLYECI